ncbi:MAG: hypothetical protein WCW33_00170 [Candidatus Babeliales bacterium]|jgi:hypothetical protein
MSLKNLCTAHAKLILSIMLFLLIFCILGIPFTHWGFKTDDWGNIYHCIIKSWSNLCAFFTEGNSEKVCIPCNVTPPDQAFFQGLYRPMSFVYYYLQYCIFGTTPYGFLLVSACFHALNAVAFFNLLSLCVTTSTAFLAAAYFGFHPSLWIWFGWTSAQTYFIELFVLFMLIYALLEYLRTQNFFFYLLGCLLYALNLLLKEQTIFLPLWLVGAFYMYQTTQDAAHSWKTKLHKALRLSSGFWLINLCYLTIRLYLYPLTAQTGTLTFQPTWQSFITRIASRFYDAVSYGNEFLGFSWLPLNHQVFKGLLIACACASLGIFCLHSPYKKYILFLFCSIPLFSWPAILMHFQPRYIYMALPLLITSAALIIDRMRTRWMVICWIFVIWNAGFLVHHMAQREKTLHMITTAFKQLVATPVTRGRSLCFVDIPSHWFGQGTSQAVWMLRNDDSKPVFQIGGTTLPSEIAREKPLIITWDDKRHKFVIGSNI